ncbi:MULTISPECIES: tRNA 2-selenouridine(34) synthase MnmH [Marivita]|uniref:tRNA 2-selenouridine(34) synthase MnmH n=1 Tax=Marivita cryptomonadis TaxID=505252 RepID=A0A9Q2NTD4_9RHOB|nr:MULTISPECIES: tRNA 2-selenouridine(34) synthase MnmH [Marivita]MCR9167321.1 tRNA 2-selenouridine(34) synthase MnmH [Paracoccaceae bacterium]MBM2320634.1 tRNA 2-selenouridine(34) synthase MnmH [Marivita cryptomonadis]MBM2330214.1 tRNA 2-selenouridine(34) synthase MnmH [Marivita cryptomonadis]MBM2339801.1 tRNA 2-selenouridine(34) synthase MnmH [Marivita cryptomonadis]MBM2344460.1 tRNA 2-selenouridine(34) synthase MnmH [Marivita cryptomonadis]
MPLISSSLTELLDHGFDTVIDVRSPAEFAEDHVPGAINLPVLDNEERARVGTIYKQVSPFDARKIGAALVFRNAANHIETSLFHHDGAWRPLVYCWRGGQRSGSFAWLLREIGWRSDVVQGGYKTYRRLVVDMLHNRALPYRFVQLGGYTGTAKTELLPLLAAQGVQVIDLEQLANHRGSLLGTMGDQPSQKAFESALAGELCRLDPARPVLVEAESSKIGQILLPPSLWDAMKVAPWIEVTAPLEARTEYLLRAYDDILSDKATLHAQLAPLKAHRGEALVARWVGLSVAGDKRALTRSLMEDHYDLAYAKSMKAMAPNVIAQVAAEGLTPAHLEQVTAQIAAALQAMET